VREGTDVGREALPVTASRFRWRVARVTGFMLLVGNLAVVALLRLRAGSLGLKTGDATAALFQ